MTDQRRVKGEETKSKILDAALEIISTQGLSSLSSKKIAEKAGISKSNVFHHFPSVELIVEELTCKLCEISMETYEEPVENSLEAVLSSFGNHIFNIDDSSIDYYKVVYALYNDKVYFNNVKDILMDKKRETRDYTKSIIRSTEGIEISDEFAELISMDIDGMMLNFIIEGDREKYLKIWDLKSKMYIKYIEEQKR